MFLTCEGTFGIVPATMDYNGEARPGDFHAGYQEIEGINLGYLQINGTQMFALAQVLSDLFKDIPRTTISKKMETLKIKSRRCDLKELRTLKAINSVPTRAVKCSLISKADLEALCTSCKSLGPRRRKRKRKSKRREQLLLPAPGGLFPCPRPPLLPPCRAGGCCALSAPAPLLPQPFHRTLPAGEEPPRGRRSCGLAGRAGGLFAGVLPSCPRALARLPPTSAPPPAPPAPRKRGPCCAELLFPAGGGPAAPGKGRSAAFPGSKRQGTSAGYSSDSDSSLDFGGSSPATSSDSSEEEEEEEEEEEGDSSCSSEEGSSSESESSSLCSGDSVQSTRYRQAALPRFPPQPPREPLGEERPVEPPLPGAGKALRPDPSLLFLSQQLWARTLRASTLESLSPAPALGSGAQPELYAKREASPSSSSFSSISSSSSPPPSPSSTPGGDPQQKEGGFGDAEPCAKGEDLHKDASNNGASLGPGEQAERPSGALPGQEPAPEPAPASVPELAGGPGPVPPGDGGEPRREHFDRLIRQSKLWCYAKGFNLDGKSLRQGGRPEPGRAAELPPTGCKRPGSPGAPGNRAARGSGAEGSGKRSRPARGTGGERQRGSAKGGARKAPRRNSRKGNAPCKRLGNAGPAPPRNSFSLMGNFPCIPSLVVGEDGDLCPASSLGGKNSWALSKTHPLWSWHLGGSAIPVPPSLKFRGCSLEDL
ncbi:elongin BC and Polycomb repressive complex 2-associated protein [Pezoporus wallicus]|uniref:elongin BC and Polycomb repressive complex 2-associated protein n=1 Tax=Pezoporus wallicus TaxID=35540 RepID=UPI00254C7065|nr:elongin BC and Polycomb repressive complex 2-associated protein [Pezoporus wallicus]XP_057258585.1 elongin BC and Polycomb repressive complex 2-associated protein [Pezoporus wallicus]